MGRSIAGTVPKNGRNIGIPATKRDRSIGNVVVVASGLPPTFKVYSSGSGTYNTPTGCTYIIVEMTGGGGGGSLASAGNPGCGGNSSSYYKFKTTSGSYSYSVGAAGVGAFVTPSSGTNGGNTTFGTATCSGGVGGNGALNTNAADSVTYTNLAYLPYTQGTVLTTNYSSPGGRGFWGSSSGVMTPAYITPGQFVHALGYGTGGAGVCVSDWVLSGDGTPGRILITEYY
jgi:hypothetical protein